MNFEKAAKDWERLAAEHKAAGRLKESEEAERKAGMLRDPSFQARGNYWLIYQEGK